MGDIGSLPLGAAMGYGAIVTRNEILLFVIGGVFMIELFSVVLQVGYFKYSGGKRIFRCAPIHHHFHLSGWSEPQVVVRFWLLSIAFAVIALATLALLAIMATIGTFKAFNSVWVMYERQSRDAVDTASILIFRTFRSDGQFGEAAEMAFILFGIILTLSQIQRRIGERLVFYG